VGSGPTSSCTALEKTGAIPQANEGCE